MTDPRRVLVPAARVVRWFDNFVQRHGPASFEVVSGALVAVAEDGARATARPPLDRAYDGPAEPADQITIDDFKRHELVADAHGMTIDGVRVIQPRLVADRGARGRLR